MLNIFKKSQHCPQAVKNLQKFSRCSLVEALEAASLHPAEAIGLHGKKGTLDFGADADFIMIDQQVSIYI
jgi:N-acetylglucosamine-6-phosphate deacetylase